MYDVSVIVPTYNSSLQKLKQTIKSILMQRAVKFEIIITDDGSTDFNWWSVVTWFDEAQFSDYHILAHARNQGTMANALSGWKLATGEYVKQLSPGDFLYGTTTLTSAVKAMQKRRLDLGFGLPAMYCMQENQQPMLWDDLQPRDLRPYYCDNASWIRYNYLEADYANGMSFIVKRNELLKYAGKLEGRVKYAEDCTYILMVADESHIGYLHDYIIWYEVGAGISTSGSDIWMQRIRADQLQCYKQVAELQPKWRYCYYGRARQHEGVIHTFFRRGYYKIASYINRPRNNSSDLQSVIPIKRPNIQYLLNLIDNA